MVGFLTRALENYRQHGILHGRATMTDNHPGYKRSLLLKVILKRHGNQTHNHQTPCPQQNGKAERYHQPPKPQWVNRQA